MRLRAASLFSVWCLLGCAETRDSVRVVGEAGANGRAPVPVYFALAPPFPYDEIGDLDVVLEGERSHLEELLAEAETRARAADADAILIREARSDGRLVAQQIWRTCTMIGPGGRPMNYSCPDIVQVVAVTGRLSAVAIRRRTTARPLDHRWPVPPPLASSGPLVGPPPPASRDDEPSMEESFGTHN